MNLIDQINQKSLNASKANWDKFRTGDSVAVHVKIPDGDKFRVQIFEGTCIAMKEKNSINGNFRVRKISSGIGVERVFPFHCPNVETVKIVNQGKSRRAKHFYLRDRKGKAARIAIDYTQRNDK